MTSSTGTPTISPTNGIQSGDTANFGQSFDTKDVGTGKTLTPAGSVSDGNSGTNYTVTFVPVTTGVINKKNLTVNGITANNKPYDGNTSATLNTSGAAPVGVIPADASNVTLSTSGATGTFASSAVGTWTVQVSGLTIGGSASGNYSLTQPTTTASILAWTASGKGFYPPVGADAAHSVFTAAGPTPTPTTLPIGMVWNTIKGGQTVPLKFNIFAGSTEMTTASAFPGSNLTTAFQAQKLNTCVDPTASDPVDFTTTGQTTLRYDTQWIQNWATPKVSQTTCYSTWVTFADGSTLEAFFQLAK
jgi:hypothetical protein